MALEFSLSSTPVNQIDSDCIIIGCYSDVGFSAAGTAIDNASQGRLTGLRTRGDLPRKCGTTLLLHDLPGLAAARVLVVGLGEVAKFDASAYIKAVEGATRALREGSVRTATSTLTELGVADRDPDWLVTQGVIAADRAAYRYSLARSENGSINRLTSLALTADSQAESALQRGIAIAAGMELARELGNLPPNICNPAYLADQARKLADAHPGVTCDVLEREDMERLGMGALLAVARGSAKVVAYSAPDVAAHGKEIVAAIKQIAAWERQLLKFDTAAGKAIEAQFRRLDGFNDAESAFEKAVAGLNGELALFNESLPSIQEALGSNSTIVAPLEIGEGSYVAAGSVVTEAVPADSLAVGRGRQVNKEGWAAKRRQTHKKA